MMYPCVFRNVRLVVLMLPDWGFAMLSSKLNLQKSVVLAMTCSLAFALSLLAACSASSASLSSSSEPSNQNGSSALVSGTSSNVEQQSQQGDASANADNMQTANGEVQQQAADNKAEQQPSVPDGNKAEVASTPQSSQSQDTRDIAAPPERKENAVVIDTEFYHIEIPASWYGDEEISYDTQEELSYPSPELGLGCITDVHIGGKTLSVSCCTDNWGPQGDFAVEEVGKIPSKDGWHITVSTANPDSPYASDFSVGRERLAQFASFVTPK